jgi:pimeloyl-ACP methyl ester carboxylesterase
MRACQPRSDGYIERDGVKVFYEVFGDGEPTVLLLPCWSIVHSRHWKAQVPYLARHFRVVAFDGRGNGRSDRPASAAAYADGEFVADAVAVLDAVGADQAVVAGLSRGGRWAVELAATHPGRVLGAILLDPAVPPLDPPETRVPSTRSRTNSTPARAGPSSTVTTGCASTATSSSSSPARCSPSRTPPSSARTWSGGGWRPPRRR